MEDNIKMDTTPKKVVKAKRIRTGIFAVLLAAAVGIGGYHTYKRITPSYKLNTTTMTNELDGTISYKSLSNKELITIIDLRGQEKYIIGNSSDNMIDPLNYTVTNLINGQKYDLSKEETEDVVYVSKVENMEDYLITLDYLKEKYSNEDLINIYNSILEFKQEQLNSKSLTK